ncbi:GDP-L-fucose synthase [soil metagenome]
MEISDRVFVAGGRGLVGSALIARLREEGFRDILAPTSAELDLRNPILTRAWFERERPTHVFLAAAKVGGIRANQAYPAEFIGDNLAIGQSVIDAAYRAGVQKLVFFGSSCIYPKLAPQPIREESLLTGPLEPTNEPYAIAKIAGLKTCQAYRRQYGFNAICLMPTNLYGPRDNFDPLDSHVLPGLLRRFHEAKHDTQEEVVVWGTGTPRREFLYAPDLAEAALFLARQYNEIDPLNVGTGEEVTIRELAETIARIVGYEGRIAFDPTHPDGTPRKLLDVSKLHAYGWRHKTDLEEGLRKTYAWYLENWERAA